MPTPLHLKLTVRCLTSCLRLDLGVTRYASTPQNLVDMMSLIKQSHDEELVANGCKCIRISLRDEKVIVVEISFPHIEPTGGLDTHGRRIGE